MAKVRAVLETKSAWLGSEFGEQLARKWFGDEIVDSLPRLTRGKNAGKIKAYLVWIKCTRGGWDNGAGVCLPGSIMRIRLATNQYGHDDSAIWWKTSTDAEPDPVNETRLSPLGQKILRARIAKEQAELEARMAAFLAA